MKTNSTTATNRPGLRLSFCLAAVLTLGACANTSAPATGGNASTYPQPNYPSSTYATYGVVQSIDLVQQPQSTGIGGTGIGVGAIAGAVVGGIIGNQVGGGVGNTAATVLGAAGAPMPAMRWRNATSSRSTPTNSLSA